MKKLKLLLLLFSILFISKSYSQITSFPDFHFNGVILGSDTSDPTGYDGGYLYFNDSSNKLRLYNGTSWENIESGSIPSTLQSVTDNGSVTTNNITISEENFGNITSTLFLGTSKISTGSLGFDYLEINSGDAIILTADPIGLNQTSLTVDSFSEKIKMKAGGSEVELETSLVSQTRNVRFQDKDGDIAYLSDTIKEGYKETGTKATSDLVVTLGDDTTNLWGTKTIIDGITDKITFTSDSGWPLELNLQNGEFSFENSINKYKVESWFYNAAKTFKVLLKKPILTADRIIDWPDKPGVIAMVSDTSKEGYNDFGTTRAGGIIVYLGDYDNSLNGTKIIIDDDSQGVQFNSVVTNSNNGFEALSFKLYNPISGGTTIQSPNVGIINNIKLPAAVTNSVLTTRVNNQYADNNGDITINTLNAAILTGLPVYANEAAAVTGGLATNSVYKTSTGELRIKL